MKVCQQEPIGRLIYKTTMALKNYLDCKLKPYDLTVEQYQVLKSLAEENGIAQSRLCVLVMKSPANMTRILDRLEKKKCVERRLNPEDRRSSLVYLTTAGNELLAQVIEQLADCNATITGGLDQDQLDLMRHGLKTICKNIEQHTGKGEK